jgi:hypothetical protein
VGEILVNLIPTPQGGLSSSVDRGLDQATSPEIFRELRLGAMTNTLTFSFGLRWARHRIKAPLAPIFLVSATVAPWDVRRTTGHFTSALEVRRFSVTIWVSKIIPPTVQGYRLYSALQETRVSLNQLKVGVKQ